MITQKRSLFLSLILVASITLPLLLTQSCSQCNKAKLEPVVVVNSTMSEPIRKLTAAISKDSLNPNLYFKRAEIHDLEGNYKSALWVS